MLTRRMRSRFFVIALGSLCFSNAYAAEPYSHQPSVILADIHASKQVGKGVYDHFCVSCHASKPLIQLGAPRKGIKEDWLWRIKKKGKKGMFKTTEEGIGNMPPRGGCFECSDEDLRQAIAYLLEP